MHVTTCPNKQLAFVLKYVRVILLWSFVTQHIIQKYADILENRIHKKAGFCIICDN